MTLAMTSRDPAQQNRDWWRGATIYQIYPRSFADSNGDGVGDLQGIVARLDYVRDLGVDAIWLSPFYRSPMKDFGYDVSDYCDVDPLFGGLPDFVLESIALWAFVAVLLAWWGWRWLFESQWRARPPTPVAARNS